MSVSASKVFDKDEQAIKDCSPAKKRRKHSKHYHSSEDENCEPTNAGHQAIIKSNSKTGTSPTLSESSSDDESQQNFKISSEIDDVSSSDLDSDASDASSSTHSQKSSTKRKRKRNDPDIFATSMSKILGSKLTSSKRNDPVLARSAQAQYISKQATDAKLESLARRKIRADKKEALKKGRIVDVLGASTVSENLKMSNQEMTYKSCQEVVEKEKKLKKIAQRGVIRLFNAVRAAQIKGEEAAREAKAKGVVSQRSKEEKINEMSKKGFLELISKGGENVKSGAVANA
ncbi:putative ribosomal rna-processing protein 15 [Erysiphe neolycopersici]|uniref:Putative ribosomal rna-processing protein 15 n=1 Tax=Erysiphe neolycopersici TaxID=212602 RepID=A0A420I6G6_9PEZI|nr:putative ribosomal rna-processing protein 15 [Erysiphe neolycopersici]